MNTGAAMELCTEAAPALPPSHSSRRSLLWRRAVVAALLTAHVVLILDCASRDFATYDETGNLTAGLSYWETGSHRLYSVNPPLPKLIASLPVWLSGPDLAALRPPRVPGDRPEWDVGDRFARNNAARYQTFILCARAAGAGWAVLGALVVYRWACVLWGTRPGLVALSAWCFEPNVIAHAHLLNSDLPGTAAGVLAAYRFRAYLLTPSWTRAGLAGLCLGMALACKFTLILLCPLWLVLWAALRFVRRPVGSPARLAGAGQFAVLVAASLLVVNVSYEFDGIFLALQDYPFVSETFAGPRADWPTETHGNRFSGQWFGRVPVPLPDDFLRGLDVQRRDFELYRERYGYLAGEWKQNGWWYYYLYAAAVKVPLGLWLLFLISLAMPLVAYRHPRVAWVEIALLALPGLVLFAAVSTQTTIQEHFRYALPALPYWLIFLGRAGVTFGAAARGVQILTAGSLLWAVGSYLALHPFSISYFNEIAGGPENGHNHLLGSNIDWGQDLLRLKQWVDAHPEARPIKIAYCNHIDPRVAGLQVKTPPFAPIGAPPSDPAEAQELGPHPGYFAVSVRFVRGSATSMPDGFGGYRYAPAHALSYFHRFRPIAKAGYSIFIYRITLEEASAVRPEYGLPPLPSSFGAN